MNNESNSNRTIIWLFAAIIIGGILLWTVIIFWAKDTSSYSKQWVSEGQEFGKLTDARGCINKALALDDECNGITCSIQNNVFLTACLDVSKPVAGFCDNVTDSNSIIQAALWEVDQCSAVNKTRQSCHQLFRTVHGYCTKRKNIGNLNSSP